MTGGYNREDHNCGTVNIARSCETATEGVAFLIAHAIEEAVAQTFERDAAAFKEWQDQTEAFDACDPTTERTNNDGSVFRMTDACNLVWAPRDRPMQTQDPDTEVDRIGRLLVDTERRSREEV